MLKAIAFLEPTFASRWVKKNPTTFWFYLYVPSPKICIWPSFSLFFSPPLSFNVLKTGTESLRIPFHHYGFGNCEKANKEMEGENRRTNVPS